MLETNICAVPSKSHFGASIVFTIVSNRGVISLSSSDKFNFDTPFFADAYTTGNSSCSSVASNSINNSITSSTTFSGFAPGLSILFITTIGFKFNANAFFKTSLV